MNKCIGLLMVFLTLAGSKTIAAGPVTRAMWVYKTEAILKSAEERQALFLFCSQRQITDLFWQVHFQRSDNETFELNEVALTHDFLHQAHAHALRIHALAGDPVHTLSANHERVLARADGLIFFNKNANTDARFDGLHLDIEPHALPQWKKASDAEKCDLLTQFVDVNTKVAERLHAASQSILYGADIVFWLDKTKPDSTAQYPVTYRGVTKDAAKHLLDVVDNVGVMSYRDTTQGRNGINALVEKAITYADKVKARVYVGVKMANIGPKKESFFGRTEAEMMTELKTVDEVYHSHRGYAGLAFFMYEAFKVMPR